VLYIILFKKGVMFIMIFILIFVQQS